MKSIRGRDEHGLLLSKNFTWVLNSEQRLQDFIRDAENGELGNIKFSVKSDAGCLDFDLQPTGKVSFSGGYAQALYKVVRC